MGNAWPVDGGGTGEPKRSSSQVWMHDLLNMDRQPSLQLFPASVLEHLSRVPLREEDGTMGLGAEQ